MNKMNSRGFWVDYGAYWLGLAVSLYVLVASACTHGEQTEQAKGAAIFAGCKASLAEVRATGEAGSIDRVETGCEEELRAWRSKK